MSSKNIISTIVVLFCLGLQAKAQVPGYLGKRISVGYNFSIGVPNLISASTPPYISFKHQFEADFVLARKFSLGLNFATQPYKFVANKYDDYSFRGPDVEDTLSGEIQTTYFKDDEIAFGATTIGGNLKIHLKGTLAPLGPYLRFGVARSTFQRKEASYNVYTDRYSGIARYTFSDDSKYNLTKLSVGVGSTSIITNNIYLKGGLNFNFIVGANQRFKSTIDEMGVVPFRRTDRFRAHVGLGIFL